jgi:hypothetical protein
MNIIGWVKNRIKKEQYVLNVEEAEKKGLTYQPELFEDCKYRRTPRYMYAQDIFLKGGWRNK